MCYAFSDFLLRCFMFKRFLLGLLLIFGISAAPAETLRGKCSYVQDGDSLKFVQNGRSEEVRVRLYGVDAPEKNQEFAAQSRKKLEKLVRGKNIRLEVIDKDKYGRYVAKVYVGKVYVNLEMLKAGLAWHYDYYADAAQDASLAKAETEARKARLGLWRDEQAKNPREHRREHGTVYDSPQSEPVDVAEAVAPLFPADAELLHGVCRHVQDGDSLCLVQEGETEDTIIQLHGVDAPERYKPYAEEARACLKQLVEKKKITVVVQTVDRYGRYVGKVYVGAKYVNQELIARGLARCHGKYADQKKDADLWAAQQQAESAKVGQWQ